MRIVLASKSEVKRKAVESYLEKYRIPYDELVCVAIDNSEIPNQPVNSALICAEMRLVQMVSWE